MSDGSRRGVGRPRTRPAIGSPEWKELQRGRMARIRDEKRRRRPPECRQCPEPAALNPKTGRALSMCREHLDADVERVVAARKKGKVDVK